MATKVIKILFSLEDLQFGLFVFRSVPHLELVFVCSVKFVIEETFRFLSIYHVAFERKGQSAMRVAVLVPALVSH